MTRDITDADGLVQFVDEINGIYLRSVLLPEVGMKIKQHTHDYAHVTYIGSGKARCYRNGVPAGDYPAGHAVGVDANCEHAFEALEPMTRLTCIHNVESAESLKAKES